MVSKQKYKTFFNHWNDMAQKLKFCARDYKSHSWAVEQDF